jgi:hypothetical protein
MRVEAINQLVVIDHADGRARVALEQQTLGAALLTPLVHIRSRGGYRQSPEATNPAQ